MKKTKKSQPAHDAKGRFRKGNCGGPGRPFGHKAELLRACWFSEVTPTIFAKVIRRLVKSALAGDVRAAEFIVQRSLGNPEPVDLLMKLDAIMREYQQESRGQFP